MAPPPEYDKEPKAPDKSATAVANEDSKAPCVINDLQLNSENDFQCISAATRAEALSKNLESLDEGGLRDLLNEAMDIKNSVKGKKSDLLNDLMIDLNLSTLEKTRDFDATHPMIDLIEVMRKTTQVRQLKGREHFSADADAEAEVQTRATAGTEANALALVPYTKENNVSDEVDTSAVAEEPASGGYFAATVKCFNPPPLAERRVTSADASCPAEMEILNKRSKPMFPMYTARATLEIGSGSVGSGRAVTTTTASNQEIEHNLSATKPSSGEYSDLVKKKKEKSLIFNCDEVKQQNLINRNTLKVLLCQSLFAQDSVNKSLSKSRQSAFAEKEVDAAIPFSSITTPEVVASCNTTSSASAVTVDPKPLQLGSCYRAVASITGALPAAASAPAAAAPAAAHEQPRNVISSTFNGLPLSRPNYGATASTAADEYKKSLDENGNAVQGIGSPVSGSSQHKKPRRKKSSKNETVITSHQIDGYQGNKDLNEVLRFIESNADGGRGAKLPRAKHKDDADDKVGKKRSAERRKDKDAKPKRATSMEELSRTKLEDLTDAPEPPRAAPPPAKPERRSWGDGARDYFREPEPAAAASAAELTDFQTVTKRRKPRRRADDGERDREPARRARPPDRSDRSNDSNDDMDSVHSLPPAAPRAPQHHAHASYADIARTRHNIPDLIESCNFYGEGEGGGAARRAEPAPAPIDADGYPALGGGGGGGAGAPARRAAKPSPPAAAAGEARSGRERLKERAAAGGAGGPPAAAPDVVADRRPAVILLDSTVRPRDMDGVTFGFDINEQLLGAGGGARRPRCDLVREAAAADASAGVPVRAGAAALRYVPPDPPHDDKHLHQIVDYVCSAWEEVFKCGGGEVRYFGE